ncbi:protein EURL homolog isoform X1 [Acipenser ruthenus]|uniref:protein EURL homolog isoform X1 n=2 Tax=Acipenser ruthenus TaxID=7906 RepID=UPI00145BDF8F|nr:protein EURL homolog isoform X1 [Acipenser ruthenus]
MSEEELFVNIDLNDDNVCSICKVETDAGTLSFCHVCFELSIEGMTRSTLLHSKSSRGHRDCFEKYHLIANQKLSRAKVSTSTYEGVKNVLSQKINWIIQYAQNKDCAEEAGARRGSRQLLCYTQQGDRTLVPQAEAPVPRYAPRWDRGSGAGLPDYTTAMLECSSTSGLRLSGPAGQGSSLCSGSVLWASQAEKRPGDARDSVQRRHKHHGREQLSTMSVEELVQLNEKLLRQIQVVFEELTQAVQDKDSLSSELHVRHIAIEQLFKNGSKLPWLPIGRAGIKSSSTTVE